MRACEVRCACVRACVRARVCVCACVCVQRGVCLPAVRVVRVPGQEITRGRGLGAAVAWMSRPVRAGRVRV